MKTFFKKTIYLIFTFIIICFYSFSQNNQIAKDSGNYKIFYYENGIKASEGTMVNGKPDGYWKTYNEKGIIKSEGNRLNFELDGLWKFYNDTGKIVLEINYKNGRKNGIKRTYLKDAIIEENFENDIKQGLSKIFYPDGKIKTITPFLKGRENGTAMEFSRDSIVITLMDYKNGFMVNKEKVNRYNDNHQKDGRWLTFYKNGILQFEGKYKNGKKNGYFKEYSKEGSLVKIEKYTDDELQVDATELRKLDTRFDFYPDGKVKVEGSYKDSVPDGIRRYYSEKGDVINSRIYKDGIIVGEGIIDKRGKKQGAWKEYYDPSKETGNKRILKTEGTYKNDNKIGSWKFYYPNGKVEQIGTYNDNHQPVDVWKWYYDSGNLRREENYVDGLPEGIMTEYNDSGKVISKGNYVAGLEEGFWFYNVGDEKQEGTYVSGKRSGLWKDYFSEGKLRFEGNYIDDVEDGKHKYYWDNGFLKEEGNYIMGKREGDWRYFNEDGTLFMIISFKDGIEKRYDGVKIQTDKEENKK